MSSFSIGISNASFYAYHGVHPHENAMGHHFLVTIKVQFDASLFQSEQLDTTVNYEKLFRIAAEEMARPRKLLESVAMTMMDAIHKEWHYLTGASIRIEKIGVQLGGKLDNSFVELNV